MVFRAMPGSMVNPLPGAGTTHGTQFSSEPGTCQPGYMSVPCVSRGPSYSLRATATWAAVRQDAVLAALAGHWTLPGLNLHVIGSMIRPLTLPQALTARACRTGSLSAVRMGCPFGPRLASAFHDWYQTLSGWVMLAGAPATMPLKSRGNCCASISPS